MTEPSVILTVPPEALRRAIKTALRFADEEVDQVWFRRHDGGHVAVWPLNNYVAVRAVVAESTWVGNGGFHISIDSAKAIAAVCRLLWDFDAVALAVTGLMAAVEAVTENPATRLTVPVGYDPDRDRRFHRLTDYEHPDPLRIGINAPMTADLLRAFPSGWLGTTTATAMTVSAEPDTVIRFDNGLLTGWVTPVAGKDLRDHNRGPVKGADQ